MTHKDSLLCLQRQELSPHIWGPQIKHHEQAGEKRRRRQEHRQCCSWERGQQGHGEGCTDFKAGLETCSVLQPLLPPHTEVLLIVSNWVLLQFWCWWPLAFPPAYNDEQLHVMLSAHTFQNTTTYGADPLVAEVEEHLAQNATWTSLARTTLPCQQCLGKI